MSKRFRMFAVVAAGAVIALIAGCLPPDGGDSGTNPTVSSSPSPSPSPSSLPAGSLGSAKVTLYLNKITGETTTGDYGVFLWVETQGGTFVKTLSYYVDWGASSTDGTNGLGTKGWFIGATTSSAAVQLHLDQSAAWRAAAGITTNKYAPAGGSSSTLDAVTSATILSTSSPIVFDGSTTSAKLKSPSTAEEYFGLSFVGKKLQGWDGTDENGDPVAAGNYVIRLTVSRKANTATNYSPHFTEYTAPLVVTSGGSAADTTFSLYNSSSDVSGNGGPVLDLSQSKVTFTPQ